MTVRRGSVLTIALPLLTALGVAAVVGCASSERPTKEEKPRKAFRQVLPTVAFEMMHDTPTIDILDVRSPEERRRVGHIVNSVNLPFDQLELRLADLEPLKRRTFLVYDGGSEDDRGARAVLLLRSQGWPEAVLIEGGVEMWRRAGFGVVGGLAD